MLPGTHDESDIFKDLSVIDEKDKIMDDLLADCAALEATDKLGVKKRPRKTLEIHQNEGNKESKKNMHRDVERQRRQEMAGLYTSLRSLLPLQYVKGKRAISDHMHQATNYIKDMEKEIEEMKIRRDKLKKLCNVAANYDAELPYPNSNTSDSTYDPVKIKVLRDGMEILISSSLNEECFPLSKVISDLVARELNVVACVSTTAHQSSIHKLQIELDETRNIDVYELQERLVNLIRLP